MMGGAVCDRSSQMTTHDSSEVTWKAGWAAHPLPLGVVLLPGSQILAVTQLDVPVYHNKDPLS